MNGNYIQRPQEQGVYALNTVPAFIIETNDTLLASLYVGQSLVYQGSYAPDFNGRINIDFAGVYENLVQSNIPDTGDDRVVHSAYQADLYAVISKLTGETTGPDEFEWSVCNAALYSAASFSVWARTHFLTNQPLEKRTTYEAPEWLTWLDRSGAESIKARFYKKNGGYVDVPIHDDDGAGCYSVNVRYSRLISMANLHPQTLLGYYDIIRYDTKTDQLAIQRYIYEERTGREKYYCMVNALGGIDTLICQGENTLSPDVSFNIGRFGQRYTQLNDTDDRRRWAQQIGMLPVDYRDWVYELLATKQGAVKYYHELQAYQEIVVTEADISMGDNGQLATASFSYMLADNVKALDDIVRDAQSLHQSVADNAEEMDDLTTKVACVFDGGITEPVTVPASLVFVTFEEPAYSAASDPPVYYYINGSQAGSFGPGDRQPVLISITTGATLHFATENEQIEMVEMSYYPENLETT